MGDDKRALVATPAARDRAIERLQDHYARNHIDTDELERRIELAERATSDAALVALLSDLPSLESVTALDVTVPGTPGAVGRVTTTIKATLASTSRRGHWKVPRYVQVRALFGAIELDLCDAELNRGETIVDVTALFGSVLITVPEGLAVECEGSAILGSFDHHSQSSASKRDGRRLKITGKARFGSVDIVVKKKTGVLEEIKSTVRGLLGG